MTTTDEQTTATIEDTRIQAESIDKIITETARAKATLQSRLRLEMLNYLRLRFSRSVVDDVFGEDPF